MSVIPNYKSQLAKKKFTKSSKEFNNMRLYFPNRTTIIAQGDSWFAYPKKWIIAGKPSNLLDHITTWTSTKSNFLSMASNGAEAVDMLSGDQKHDLIEVLRWHDKGEGRKPADLLLFSGGGNGIVGENNAERFMRPYKSGFTAKQCVRIQRLKRKCKQVALSIEELLDIRDQYSPTTIVIIHTYDYPYASLQGGAFVGGLIKTKSWVKPYMDEYGIPEKLQTDIIKIFMDSLAVDVLKLAAKRKGLVVADTRGTLKGQKHWIDEIHPDTVGFKKVAKVVYGEMIKVLPGSNQKK